MHTISRLWLSVALAAAALPAGAVNLKVNVDKSGPLWWNAPEIPSLHIALCDSTGAANRSDLQVRITPDNDEAHAVLRVTYPIDLAKGRTQEFDMEVTNLQPGFYKVFIDDDGTLVDKFNIGYEPALTVSLPDHQPDFAEFWQKALAELAQQPADLQLTELTEQSGQRRKMYEARFLSLGGDTIIAHAAIPAKEGKYPVRIYYNGYGAQPWDLQADACDDWIEMATSVRGQYYCVDNNKYGDWIQYHLDDPATYYYRGAYMDAVRAIDVAQMLPNADAENIFLEGGSQGGALTLAAAALDPRPRAIAPYIPFMSDFRDYFTIVDWPASAVRNAQQQLGLSDERVYRNLSYFDIKNHARNITCPVMMGIGLQDPVCPPHTNMASYALLTVPKELHIYTLCGHTVDYDKWNPARDAFFARHKKH